MHLEPEGAYWPAQPCFTVQLQSQKREPVHVSVPKSVCLLDLWKQRWQAAKEQSSRSLKLWLGYAHYMADLGDAFFPFQSRSCRP